MTLKIEKSKRGRLTIFALSGSLDAEHQCINQNWNDFSAVQQITQKS
jgi:hypothetical protein